MKRTTAEPWSQQSPVSMGPVSMGLVRQVLYLTQTVSRSNLASTK